MGAWNYKGTFEAPKVTDIDIGPPARMVDLKNWDGRSAIVDHDGSCYLIIRRTYYPGWTCRVNDGPEQPVLKVNGGLQGVPLTGTGTSRVHISIPSHGSASGDRSYPSERRRPL